MTISLASLETFVMLFLVFSIIGVAFYLYALYEKEQQQNPTGRRLKNIVFNESPILKALFILNQKYNFHTITPRYTFHHECASKAEFDRISMDDIFARIIKENLNTFQNNDKLIENNKRMYTEYQQEFKALRDSVYHSPQSDAYKQAELSFLDAGMIKLNTQYEVIITKGYVSPMGKNEYSDQKTFYSPDISKYIAKANRMNLEHEKRKAQIEYERSLMTSSMRYDILRRDKGRCVLCGASASDGVRLHVDHIIPVSKGGKTIPSNLRTLCERCNVGKKDKYDPKGFN